jgi:hypothetical protein
MCSQIQMTDSDVETGSAACTGICCLRMDQELATATRGRVQLVLHNSWSYIATRSYRTTHCNYRRGLYSVNDSFDINICL